MRITDEFVGRLAASIGACVGVAAVAVSATVFVYWLDDAEMFTGFRALLVGLIGAGVGAYAGYTRRQLFSSCIFSLHPRRWRLRFSLRTVFVIVTILAVPLGWLAVQLKWIRDRHEEWKWVLDHREHVVGPLPDDTTYFPWSLRLLGEEKYDMYLFFDPLTTEEAQRIRKIRALFPEATVETGHLPGNPTDDLVEARVKMEDELGPYRGRTAEIVDPKGIDTLRSWFNGYGTPQTDMAPPGKFGRLGTIELVQRDGSSVTIEFTTDEWRVIHPEPRSIPYVLKTGFWKDLESLLEKQQRRDIADPEDDATK